MTKAIREAGGEVIREDAQTKLPVNVGDAVITTAGRLRQKYVFHCITIDKSVGHSNTPEGISEDDIHQYIIGNSIDKYRAELKDGFLGDLRQYAEAGVIPKKYEADVEKIKKMLNE